MRTDVLLAVVLICGLLVDETTSSWSYRDDNGPKYWEKNYKDCSDNIQNQSPIDIPKSSGRTYDKDLQTLEFINYDQQIKAEAKNDGSNIRFQKILTSTDKKIYISKGSLDIGVKYVASELNFHWSLYNKDEKKIESGHRLEGKKFPMELHILHYRDDYDSLDKAKDYHDGVAIVVFFIKQGEGVNERYHTLTNYLQELKFKATDDKTVVDIEGFSLRALTNKDIKVTTDSGKHLHYYYYEGTSTSPPCYHAKWFVFKDPVELDEFQINLFRGMKRVKEDGSTDDAYDLMGPNFRPVQDLAGRKVYESDDSSNSSSSIMTASMVLYIFSTCFWLVSS